MTTSTKLQVRVQPMTIESSSYLFTVINSSQQTLRNIEFNFYDVLGPIDFGLDDTRMPKSLTSEPKLLKDILLPGESTQIEISKWGPLSRYKGQMVLTVKGRFVDDNSTSGHALTHEVHVTILSEPQSAS